MAIVKKPKTGRPTLYKEEFCDALIDHMSEGLSFESFGATIGVNRDTVYEWAKVHSAFSDAKKRGLDLNLLFWEKVGIQGLWQAFKGDAFNATVWIFNMKNRHEWRDKKAINVEAAKDTLPQIIVSLPDNGMGAKL